MIVNEPLFLSNNYISSYNMHLLKCDIPFFLKYILLMSRCRKELCKNTIKANCI